MDKIQVSAWPRLMSLQVVALYSSIAESTWRDYINDKLIESVRMPGSTLRDRSGRVVAHGRDRKIVKILLAKEDVDAFIDRMKGAA
ncbi:MAG TPA: hypothetical protein VE398_25385 [Acidobacteriota bacterium]|nr:hypothetical protein [Acidobacteriota bacterium]